MTDPVPRWPLLARLWTSRRELLHASLEWLGRNFGFVFGVPLVLVGHGFDLWPVSAVGLSLMLSDVWVRLVERRRYVEQLERDLAAVRDELEFWRTRVGGPGRERS